MKSSFFVNGVNTKTAHYPADQWEHNDVNVWLTAISTNYEDSDQELSRAQYDYFRYYEPGQINVLAGETRQIGGATDFNDQVGGSITTAGFGSQAPGNGSMAGDIVIESGGMVNGAGTLFGNVTVQSGGRLSVATQLAGAASSETVTSEDFESFTPGVAFVSNAATGLTPTWSYHDLGTSGDVEFVISGADGTAQQPVGQWPRRRDSDDLPAQSGHRLRK